jgi:hypothetical protein
MRDNPLSTAGDVFLEAAQHFNVRWKSSLLMKGEVVTHQLDCAVRFTMSASPCLGLSADGYWQVATAIG